MTKQYAEYVTCIRSFAGIEATYAKAAATTTGTLQGLARKAGKVDTFLAGCKAAETAYRDSAGKSAKLPRAWVNAKSVIKYAMENGVSLAGTYSKVMQAVTKARKARQAADEAGEAGQDASSTPAAIVPEQVRTALQSIGNKVVQLLVAGGDEGQATVLRILGATDDALGELLRAVLPVEPVKDDEADEEPAKPAKASRAKPKAAKASRKPRQPKAA